ncbi:MAG: molybdopterin-dependent oxidoreductase [bacterium]|nr:molybdopterin-dependent oxidoreductase [bacterium]
MSVLGTSIKRREDPALITGKGKYTDDFSIPGTLHAVIVRSPFGHARVNRTDTSAAAQAVGVVAIYTAAELEASGTPGVIPTAWLLPDLKTPVHTLFATDRVRYVGHPVAVVVAESAPAGHDAAGLIEVDYEPLPAVVDPKAAAADGAPLLYDEAPSNVAFDWEVGDKEATDAAFAAAATTATVTLRNNRTLPHAIEPRAALAQWDAENGKLTLTMTSQNPHVHRLLMTIASLGLPEHKIRVIAPEVGGGFGSKIHHYADEAITAWCAMQTGRPVKWTATRSETNMTDAHGRDHWSTAGIAIDSDGKIVGLRIDTHAAMGAYLSTFAPAVPTYLYGTLFSGQYDIPAIHVHVLGTFTNTAPVDAVRGAGRPEATYAVERLMDAGAAAVGLDPAEFRRRNFIQPDAFPYQTQVALAYDSGDYPQALEKALEAAGYDDLRAEQAKRLDDQSGKAKILGVGLSSYIEACGIAPSAVVGSLGAQAGLWESAKVRVHPSGSVTVYTGSCAHGQGHATTFSQIVADRLGIDVDQIDVIHGDTEEVQFGMGTYGSRSAAVGGSAIVKSLDKVIAKGKRIAAHLLEASPDDIEFEGGEFKVKGSPGHSKAWGDVVLNAYLAHNLPEDIEPGLEETSFYDPANFTYPFGTHIAVVEIDRETGEIDLLRYIGVDDCGNQINPMIVEGQVHGGIAHGLGQALWEEAAYDESGQLVSGTLLDYALPRAHHLVPYELDYTVTPCPHNPLGVKGIGEAGAIAAPAAVANAVGDALRSVGAAPIDMPFTPEKIWRTLQGGGA